MAGLPRSAQMQTPLIPYSLDVSLHSHHLQQKHSSSQCRTNSPVTSNPMDLSTGTVENAYSQQDSMLEKEKLSEPQNEVVKVNLNEAGEQCVEAKKQNKKTKTNSGRLGSAAQPFC